MNVEKKATFPFPVLFLKGAEAFSGGSRVLGALLAKQAIPFVGNAPQPPVASEILLTDTRYTAADRRVNDPPDPSNTVYRVTKIEADVTVYKPRLDVVAVSPFTNIETFGDFTVTRGGASVPRANVLYGWRERGVAPRRGRAGQVDTFEQDQENPDPFKLPTGFNDLYFNGSPVAALGSPIRAGDSVRFDGQVIWSTQANPDDIEEIDLTVTIPDGPTLMFTRDCWSIAPPVMVSQGVDTVVLLAGERRVLLTWRFVFVWEERLALATLEVS